jgi:hypothetical protein
MVTANQSFPDIPFTAPHVLETLEQTHLKLNVTAEGPPTYVYSLAVPRTWAYSKQFGPVTSGPFATRGIGFVAGSARPGSPVIAVTVTPIPYEIPIDAWIMRSLTVEGWSLVSAKWFAGARLFFDVVGTRVLNNVPEIRRTSVRVDAHNIFAVNCLCARKHWDEAKETFWVAHDTFQVENGTGTTVMEPWMLAKATDPDFQLARPRSWSVEAETSTSDGISAVHLRLVDARGKTLLAYVQAKVERLANNQPPPTLDELRATASVKLQKAGFTPSQSPRPLTAEEDPRAMAVPGWRGGFVGKGHLAKADVTSRMGFIARPGYSMTLLMLSPLLEDDPLTALRAQRAFEIAHATLEIA